jgi:hypothetical protein
LLLHSFLGIGIAEGCIVQIHMETLFPIGMPCSRLHVPLNRLHNPAHSRLYIYPVVTEYSVRSENTGVPIIREIMVATTMSSLFVAFFTLPASTKERPLAN